MAHGVVVVGTVLTIVGLFYWIDQWQFDGSVHKYWSGAFAAVVAVMCGLAVGAEFAPTTGMRWPDFVTYSTLLLVLTESLVMAEGVYWYAIAYAALVTVAALVAAKIILGLSSPARLLKLLVLVVAFIGYAAVAAWYGYEVKPGPLAAFLILAAGALGTGNLLFDFLAEDFERTIELEEVKATTGGVLPATLSRAASLGGKRIFGLGVAGFTSILLFVISTSSAVGMQDSNGTTGFDETTLLGICGCIFLLLIANIVFRNREAARLLLCGVAATVWGLACFSDIQLSWSWRTWLILPLIMVAAWLLQSIVGNSLLLAVRTAQRWTLFTVPLVVSSVVASGFWASSEGLHDKSGTASSFSWSLFDLASVLVVDYGLVLTAATTLHALGRVPTHITVRPTQYGLVRNISQDYWLMSALLVGAAWLPLLSITHSPHFTWRDWYVPTFVGGFVIFLSPAFFWVLRNNTRHTAFERHIRRGTPTLHEPYPLWTKPASRGVRRTASIASRIWRRTARDDDEWIELLENHTNAQNITALLFLFAMPICLVAYLNGYYQRRR